MEPERKRMRLSTPKVSEFYFGASVCTLQELKDFLSHLKKTSRINNDAFRSQEHAERAAHQLTIQCGLHAWGKTAEFVMMLCGKWHLKEETKYTALEIFNLFMTSLISQLHDLIYSSRDTESCGSELVGRKGSSNVISPDDRMNHMNWTTRDSKESKQKVADKEWHETLELITSQMKLRAVSSVMIASKVTDHEGIITMNKALSFLVEQGQHYSKNVIIKSELRILKSINYDTRRFSSPHCCVMLLLEILCQTRSDIVNAQEVYLICVKLLDLFYYFRPYVIGNLCSINVSDCGFPELSDENESRQILETSSDIVRISASLLCAAVYIRNKRDSDDVITFLSALIGLDEKSLTRDCCVMLKTLLRTNC